MSDTRTPGHRELTPNEVERIAAIKDAEAAFLEVLDQQTPFDERPNREISLAVTNIQQAAMWAVRGVTARFGQGGS